MIQAQNKAFSVAALSLCALLWSTAGFLVKMIDWDPMAIAGIRSLIGLAVMVIIIRRPDLSLNRDRLLAALFYSATMILFVSANKLTTAANAVLLQYTEPVFIILLGLFLLRDEKPSLIDWLCVLGVFGGMVLFFLDDISLSANLGNILAVVSGLTFALFALFMRRQKTGSPVESFMIAHIITFLVALPFIVRAGPPNVKGSVALLALGIFQMGLPSLLYSRGVRGVSAVSTAMVTMIEPLFNPLWVFLFVGELPSVRAFFGGLIILFCVLTRTIFKLKKV